ncbi:MAG: hypothetical protein QW794_07890 [Thermosphaera sp.]
MPKIVERKPHPNSSDHEVIVFKTKVMHEIAVPKGVDMGEVMKLITRYLKGYDEERDGEKVHVKGYEDYYPETVEEVKEES